MQPFLFGKAVATTFGEHEEPVYDRAQGFNILGNGPAVSQQILFRTTTSTNAKVESFDEDY